MNYFRVVFLLLLPMATMTAAGPPVSTANDEVLRQTLVGVWSMEASFGIAKVTSYARMNADGTYVSVGSLRVLGTTKDIFEEGTWTIERGIVSTAAALTLDPEAGAYSSSKIMQLDQARWRAEAIDGKKKKTEVTRTRVASIPESFVEQMTKRRKELKEPKHLNQAVKAQP